MALRRLGFASPLAERVKVWCFVRQWTLCQKLSPFGPDGIT